MKKSESHLYTLATQYCYNPFFFKIDGVNQGEIKSIHFYDEDGVKYVTKWFDVIDGQNKKFNLAKYPIGSNNGFKVIELPFTNIPLRRKKEEGDKTNFTRKDDAFIMHAKDYMNNSCIELYININSVKGFEVKNIIDEIYTKTETRSETRIAFPVKSILKSYKEQGESSEYKEHIAVFSCNWKFKDTEYGTLCKEIVKILNNNTISCSTYEVDKMISKGDLAKICEVFKKYKNSK